MKNVYILVAIWTDGDNWADCSHNVTSFRNLQAAKNYLYQHALDYSREYLDYGGDEEARIRDLEGMMNEEQTRFEHVSDMNNYDYLLEIHKVQL